MAGKTSGCGALALLLFLGAGFSRAAEPPPRLKARCDRSYPPYEFVDRSGRLTGFNVELLQAVAGVMGLEIDIVPGPWSEVRQELEQGRIDLLTGMFQTAERARLVSFSTPFITVTQSVFVRRGSEIRGVDDLRGKRVVVERGDIMHDFILRLGTAGDVTAVNDPEEVLRRLAAGYHDGALLGKLQGLYLAHRYGLSNLEAVGPPLDSQKYCFAVRKGDDALLGKLNEGLAILQATGAYETIRTRWFGLYEKTTDARAVWKTVGLIVGPVVVLLTVVFIWSWSLRRQVAARTRELQHELGERRRAEQESLQANQRLKSEISERMQAEENLRATLLDKEVLLRELYHRTKNNIQLISSMLQMHSLSVENPQMKEILTTINQRILAIALVHNKLQESRDLSHVNLLEYFGSLKDLIRQGFVSSHLVQLRVEGENTRALIDIAIPCGIIVNELITNAIKYAFPRGEGTVVVRVRPLAEDELLVEVQDDGIGFPPGFDVEKEARLGLSTVFQLVRQQLRGEIRLEPGRGVHWSIRLQKQLYRPRV